MIYLGHDHQHQNVAPHRVDVDALRRHVQQAHGVVDRRHVDVAELDALHRDAHRRPDQGNRADPSWSSYGAALWADDGPTPAPPPPPPPPPPPLAARLVVTLEELVGLHDDRHAAGDLHDPRQHPDSVVSGAELRAAGLNPTDRSAVASSRYLEPERCDHADPWPDGTVHHHGSTWYDHLNQPIPRPTAIDRDGAPTSRSGFVPLAEALHPSLASTPTVDRNGAPMPIPNDGVSVHDLVVRDVTARKAFGVRRYGTPLQANNGRNALQDLYEELLDAACYVRQRLEEDRQRAAGHDATDVLCANCGWPALVTGTRDAPAPAPSSSAS